MLIMIVMILIKSNLDYWALMQYRIHVDISTSTRPICTKITENTPQPISNHSRKFELLYIIEKENFLINIRNIIMNYNYFVQETVKNDVNPDWT